MPRKRPSKHVEPKNPKTLVPRHFNHHWASGELAAPTRSLAWLPCCLGNFGLLKHGEAHSMYSKKIGKKNEKDHRKNGRNISLKVWQVTFLSGDPMVSWCLQWFFQGSPGGRSMMGRIYIDMNIPGPWWRHPATLRRKVAVATKDHLGPPALGKHGKTLVVRSGGKIRSKIHHWIILVIGSYSVFFEKFKRYREREGESQDASFSIVSGVFVFLQGVLSSTTGANRNQEAPLRP